MSRHLDDLMLGTLELFCLAAEHGSFVAAARRAGVTPAAVSRTIARLESRLGTRLFARTTRRIRLTEQGEAYYARCRQALTQLVEAERELSGRQVRPGGTIRISLPTPLAHLRILPLLPEFRQRYPDVALDVHVSNRNIDFVAEGFDLAVRGRNPPDSGLVARRLLDDPLVVVAAPGYLADAGTPATLEDLAGHECIQFDLPSSGQRVPWLFRREGVDVDVPAGGGLRCSDDLLATITLARHGGGLIQVPRFMVEEDLRRGVLVEVMRSHAGRTRSFSLLYPANRHMPLRTRVFIDFLLERIAGTAGSG
ncbi:LysR family transcriptional regulator [Luteimonas marina]|uniref:LysR family transcriptional regulator n=1 Tax=Luteimonas marina TaxID=488485 RepID=A0A5C5UA92_9GAMM|nr:LysR family transcriptional regulator [Luteimonas marina]TWT23321.1 LysR family transcriptional regulator [Luteimonas marina]